MQVAEKGKCPFMHPSISQWGSRSVFRYSWGTGPAGRLTVNAKQHNGTRVDSFTVAYRKRDTQWRCVAFRTRTAAQQLHGGVAFPAAAAAASHTMPSVPLSVLRHVSHSNNYTSCSSLRAGERLSASREISGSDEHRVGGQTDRASKMEQFLSLCLTLSLPQGLKWILNEHWCMKRLLSSKGAKCMENPAPGAASETRPSCALWAPFVCSAGFLSHFFPVSEVVVNAFGMTQTGVCVWACVSGVTVATCVWMDSLVAELKAFTCAFCCSLLMAPGLTLSCPLPLLVIAVVALCPTEPLVDLWQEQSDVNRLFFFF